MWFAQIRMELVICKQAIDHGHWRESFGAGGRVPEELDAFEHQQRVAAWDALQPWPHGVNNGVHRPDDNLGDWKPDSADATTEEKESGPRKQIGRSTYAFSSSWSHGKDFVITIFFSLFRSVEGEFAFIFL